MTISEVCSQIKIKLEFKYLGKTITYSVGQKRTERLLQAE